MLNNLINFYNTFISFFYFKYLSINFLSFFKKFFLNLNYINNYSLKSNKKLYLFYYIMFKKQNSILKKKFNFLHNLHPIFYKKTLKKRFVFASRIKKNQGNSNRSFRNTKVLKNYFNLQIFYKSFSSLKTNNTLKSRKKLKKLIILNRKLFKFISNLKTNITRKLNKKILLKSRLKIIQNLLNMEYSLINVILSTNILRSYLDLKILIKYKCIYLNRSLFNNTNKVLESGDILEFLITYKVFRYINYFKSIELRHIHKVKNKIWYKLRLKNKSKLDYNKKSIINNLFKNNIIFKNSIPNYLEIDYCSLSIIIILKNLNIYSFNVNIKKILIIYLFKLYNWK